MSSFAALPQQYLSYPPSPSYSAGYPRRDVNPYFPDLQGRSVAKETTHALGGLATPPAEYTMSAAYHHPVVAPANTYDSHVALARHPGAMVPSRGSSNPLYDTVAHSYSRPPAHPPLPSQLSSVQTLVSQPGSGASRHSTQPSTPTAAFSISSHSEGTISRKDSILVSHSLQLPDFISPNGGALDEFAASMTCFFWFETMDTIQAAEQINIRRPSEPLPPLSEYTRPSSAYKKWVHSLLTTTQVTQNVVFLALLFVYRLKKTNPRVHGNPGSEYRLLTVALMLGNKFLDDNTYTNKTWADVSGIAVKEIHVMEVEFLSNMRYGLLTSKEQWKEWLQKLACYRQYYERAQMEEGVRQMQAGAVHISPQNRSRYASPLPSPTVVLPPNLHGVPSALTSAYSPVAPPQNGWNGTYHHGPTVSPLAAKPSLGYPLVRKRSFEVGETVEPPAKRVSRQPPVSVIPSMRSVPAAADSVRLPVPQLTLDTSQNTLPGPYGSSNYAPPQSMSLPPLVPGVRAMSTVYSTPVPTTTWAQQAPSMVTTCGPQTPAYTLPSNYATPTKRHSPPGMPPFGSSPMAEVYASHTPISNSPSVYLQQRASPYKPVRRVHTLLNPPPSMPLSEYHLGSGQMHYQPLGRRNDLRSGVVPEFLSPYDYPRHPPSHQRYH
ncbi:hypothetical protein GGR57DRAFT_239855 [Xylariaceae sp. FL1272]|nr:hypothetical protein GGR57DRAFT_239855 [Xylariaceae sp. FL1272]